MAEREEKERDEEDEHDDDPTQLDEESHDNIADHIADEENDDGGGSHDSHDPEFQLPHPVNPLGGRSYQLPENPHEQWNFNLGMVADMASSQISRATAAAGSILPLNLYRRKSFSLTFQSKSIPFEFTTNAEGNVVVSHVSKSVDPRLHRGVIILGVNDSLISIQQNASEEMEKLLESAKVPFSITFEELNEGSEGDPDYEEESTGTKTDSSIDDQDQHHIIAKEQHDDSESYPAAESSHRSSLAAVASTSASLLSSSLFSLTSKVRALVTPAEQSNSSLSTAKSMPIASAPEYHHIPDNSFELILSGRSPPFVFDLHADGNSIVVVKIIGDKKSLDPRLQEGCVVRYVNDIEVKCRSRQEFDQLLASVEVLPLRLILEHAPALYRHQDALSLYTTGQHEQAIHIFTVMPNSFTFQTSHHHDPMMSIAYDDIYRTSQRAIQVLQAFRAQGISVELISMETVLVGTNSAYSGILNTHPENTASTPSLSHSIVASILPNHAPLLRGIRVWFRFPDALQISVKQPINHVGSLEVTRNGENGTWIVIRCIVAQSPWIEEGMILGRPYLLTQVNGYDTSASGYRSINTRIPGNGEWESILPFFNMEEINLTIV